MAGTTTAVIGAGAAVGGLLEGRKARKDANRRAADAAAASEFRPFDVNVGGNQVLFGNDAVTLEESEFNTTLRNFLQQQALQSADPTSVFAQTGQDALGLFGNRFQGAASTALDPTTGQIDPALLNTFNQQNDLTRQGIAAALGTSLGGIGASPNAALAQSLFNRGQGLFDTDFSSVADTRLDALRRAARPAEERLVNSRIQNLFNTGRLGTTGGATALGELQSSLDRADLERVVASQNMAISLRQQDRSFGQGLFGIAGNLQGQDLQRSGLFGNLANNLLTQQANLDRGQLEANLGFGSSVFNRAQQRLAAAQNLFGFGTTAPTQGLASNLGLLQTMDDQQRALIALGGNIGGQQAQAAANAGQFLTSQRTGNADLFNGIANLAAGFGEGGAFSGLFSRGSSAPVSSSVPINFGDMSFSRGAQSGL